MLPELQQPGYLHVLINHLPIIGTAMGFLALLVALLLRSRVALIPALAVVIFAGVSAWPVYVTGSNAYRPVMKIADDPGRDWLNEHMDRADRATWVFYAMAGVALVALVAPIKWPKSAIPLGIAAAFSTVIGLGAAGYIAKAGGYIRHIEFRVPGLSPPSDSNTPSEEHHHH